MTGRPSTFTQEIADEICRRLANGESLRSICADQQGGWMPSETTVYRWLQEDDGFRDNYTGAREAQADHYFDQIVEIADSPTASIDPETGATVLNDVQRDRLRVDARKWVAARLAPKKYGEKLDLTHAGSITLKHEDALAALK